MSRNTWLYPWAALLAAILVGCDSPVEPDITIEGIVSPSGLVNETVLATTPVEFRARITNASPQAAITWREGNEVVCTGNPCWATRPIGTRTVTIEVRDGGRVATASSSYTIRPNGEIVITAFEPTDGSIHPLEAVPCRVEYKTDPPRPFSFSVSWRLASRSVSCEGGRLSGIPGPGLFELSVTVEAVDQNITASRQSRIRIYDFLLIRSVTPALGSEINVTVPPETDVFTTVVVEGAVRPVETFWFKEDANTPIVPTSNVITISANGVDTIRTTLPGAGPAGGSFTVPVMVRDSLRRIVWDTTHYTIPADSIEVIIGAPSQGTVITQGESLPCRIVEFYNPRRYSLRTRWSLDGSSGSCSEESGLLVSGVPASEFLAPGLYPVVALTEALGRENLTDTDTTFITIRARPWQIIFTWVDVWDNRDFYLVDEDGRNLTRLTNSGGLKYWPALSPDGTKLVYQIRNGSCVSNLVIANRDGSNPRELTTRDVNGECFARTAEAPYFSPDGRVVAFIGSWGESGTARALLINVDGSGLRLLLGPERAGAVYIVFHPNGREVITGYSETLSENPFTNRFVYIRKDIETGAEQLIFVDATTQSGESLRPSIYDVSPDGEWVTFTTPFTTQQIGILRTDGSAEIRWLTPEGSNHHWAFFCYGGEYVCYPSRPERNSLRRVDLNGQNDEEIFSVPGAWLVETPRRWPPFPE